MFESEKCSVYNTLKIPPLTEQAEPTISNTRLAKFRKKLIKVLNVFSKVLIGLSVFCLLQFAFGCIFWSIDFDESMGRLLSTAVIGTLWKVLEFMWWSILILAPLGVVLLLIFLGLCHKKDKNIPFGDEKLLTVFLSPVAMVIATFIVNYLINFSLCYVSW